MTCQQARERFDAYFDRELPALELEKVEAHLKLCESCHQECERVFSMNQELHAAFWNVPTPSPGFEAGLNKALHKEARYIQLPLSIRMRKISLQELSWVAAAAVLIAAFLGGADRDWLSRRTQDAGLMQDVVRLHSQQLPSDVSPDQPTQVSNYFRNRVGFAVRPASFRNRNARFVGARLGNVREYSAAVLYYNLNGARVTVVVFRAPHVDEQAERLRVDNQEILFRDVEGYPITMRERDGMVYAFLGDFDRDTMMQLAAQAEVGY